MAKPPLHKVDISSDDVDMIRDWDVDALISNAGARDRPDLRRTYP